MQGALKSSILVVREVRAEPDNFIWIHTGFIRFRRDYNQCSAEKTMLVRADSPDPFNFALRFLRPYLALLAVLAYVDFIDHDGIVLVI